MSLSSKGRRRLAILILVVGLPIYVVVAVNVAEWLGRPNAVFELIVYVALGLVWIVPLRRAFLGVGREDPGPDRDER